MQQVFDKFFRKYTNCVISFAIDAKTFELFNQKKKKESGVK